MLANRFDDAVRPLADRHYNRQKVGARGFVPPGRCMVLHSLDEQAYWVTSWPFAEYVRHAWAGAWMNTAFRNESGVLSSPLIREAVAVTRWYAERCATWRDQPEPPLGMVTFVSPAYVQPVRARKHKCRVNCGRREIYGYSYMRAGFWHVGFTRGGLWAWQLLVDDMPAAAAPLRGNSQPLFREMTA